MSSRTWLRTGLQAVAGAAALMFATPVLAVYPERPITLVVPFAAGGPTDIISRLMAEPMSRALGQQVIVENVVGAGGTVGVTRVAKAPPDGYMLSWAISAPRPPASGSIPTWPTTRAPISSRS